MVDLKSVNIIQINSSLFPPTCFPWDLYWTFIDIRMDRLKTIMAFLFCD